MRSTLVHVSEPASEPFNAAASANAGDERSEEHA